MWKTFILFLLLACDNEHFDKGTYTTPDGNYSIKVHKSGEETEITFPTLISFGKTFGGIEDSDNQEWSEWPKKLKEATNYTTKCYTGLPNDEEGYSFECDTSTLPKLCWPKGDNWQEGESETDVEKADEYFNCSETDNDIEEENHILDISISLFDGKIYSENFYLEISTTYFSNCPTAYFGTGERTETLIFR